MSRSEFIQLARSSYHVSEDGYIVTARSGIIAAAQPALSLLWNWQLPNAPTFGAPPIILERLRLTYTCLTAFTTPVTAGRGLAFVKLGCVLTIWPREHGIYCEKAPRVRPSLYLRRS